jgi:hypothetical protein
VLSRGLCRTLLSKMNVETDIRRPWSYQEADEEPLLWQTDVALTVLTQISATLLDSWLGNTSEILQCLQI